MSFESADNKNGCKTKRSHIYETFKTLNFKKLTISTYSKGKLIIVLFIKSKRQNEENAY